MNRCKIKNSLLYRDKIVRQISAYEYEKLPTIGIKSDSRELALCVESYPDFRTVLHGEDDIVLAVDRNKFHHAVPEADIVFRDGILAFFQERKVMLDGFAAGILVVDFSLHLVKAALGFLIPGSERFVLFVVISLVLRHMGVLVNAVLYQPCDNVQLIGKLRSFLFKSGCVEG